MLSLIRRENEQKGGNFLSKLDTQIGVASCSSSRTIRHERGDHCGLSKGKLRAIRLGTRRSAVSPVSSSSNRSRFRSLFRSVPRHAGARIGVRVEAPSRLNVIVARNRRSSWRLDHTLLYISRRQPAWNIRLGEVESRFHGGWIDQLMDR